MLPHLYNLVKNFTQPREIIWPPAFNNFTEIGTIHSQSILYRQNKYINIFREIYFTPSLTAFQVQCSQNIFMDKINLLMLKKHLFRFVVEGAADVPHGRDNFSIGKDQFSFPPPPHLPPELDGWDHHWRKHGECCHLSPVSAKQVAAWCWLVSAAMLC